MSVRSHAIHAWVRRHYPPPESCPNCNKVKRLDLANVTGVYSRVFSNWKYLCHKCHMILDKWIDMSDRKCSACGSNKTSVQCNGRPHWHYSKVTEELLCDNCHAKVYRLKNREKLHIRFNKRYSIPEIKEKILAYNREAYRKRKLKQK
jgi:hypothetical protein